jgi:hypothetical protein
VRIRNEKDGGRFGFESGSRNLKKINQQKNGTPFFSGINRQGNSAINVSLIIFSGVFIL